MNCAPLTPSRCALMLMLACLAWAVPLAEERAAAQAPGVIADPDSPAGKEYALPLDDARGDAAGPPGSSGSGGGGRTGAGAGGGAGAGAGGGAGVGTSGGGPSPLFGAGITPPQSAGAAGGSPPQGASSGGGAGSSSQRPGDKNSVAQLPDDAVRDGAGRLSQPASSPGEGSFPQGDAVLVLLAIAAGGLGIGLVMRRVIAP